MKNQSRRQEISNSQRQEIVNEIIKTINEANGQSINWNKLWDASMLVPQNPLTGTKYKGVNKLWLALCAKQRGYKDPRWITFAEMRKHNANCPEDEKWQMQKGSQCCYIEKWSMFSTKENLDSFQESNDLSSELDSDLGIRFPYLQDVFSVFNVDCIDGFPELALPKVSADKLCIMADRYIDLSPCEIKECCTDQAFYQPNLDYINIPLRSSFGSNDQFLAVLWHELAHSTNKEGRILRNGFGSFGSQEYAVEELRAELSSLFIQAEMGFGNLAGTNDQILTPNANEKLFMNSVAYLQSWAQEADEKDIAKSIFDAMSDADKISDYITTPYERKYDPTKVAQRTLEEFKSIKHEVQPERTSVRVTPPVQRTGKSR